MTAVIRMYLTTQSEYLYKMRNSMLMKFTPTVTGGGEISFTVAACELRSEGAWRAVARELRSGVCSRQVEDGSSGAREGYSSYW